MVVIKESCKRIYDFHLRINNESVTAEAIEQSKDEGGKLTAAKIIKILQDEEQVVDDFNSD